MQEFLGNLTVLRQLHPVDCAAILHLNLVTTHPFSDGNGRTAQLLMNLALLQAGYILLCSDGSLYTGITACSVLDMLSGLCTIHLES